MGDDERSLLISEGYKAYPSKLWNEAPYIVSSKERYWWIYGWLMADEEANESEETK